MTDDALFSPDGYSAVRAAEAAMRALSEGRETELPAALRAAGANAARAAGDKRAACALFARRDYAASRYASRALPVREAAEAAEEARAAYLLARDYPGAGDNMAGAAREAGGAMFAAVYLHLCGVYETPLAAELPARDMLLARACNTSFFHDAMDAFYDALDGAENVSAQRKEKDSPKKTGKKAAQDTLASPPPQPGEGRAVASKGRDLPAESVDAPSAPAERFSRADIGEDMRVKRESGGEKRRAGGGKEQGGQFAAASSAHGVAGADEAAGVLPDYRIFTARHDRIAAAEDLASPAERARFRAELLKAAAESSGGSAGRYYGMLAAKLSALSRPRAASGAEYGRPDPRKYPLWITGSGTTDRFIARASARRTDTAVTLLLDNSGSMRGRPALLSALCALHAARALEAAGASCEILGFTTREWQGGSSAADWRAAGRPAAPGRLNDVLHIIYKKADTPLRRAESALGVMLKGSLFKENIDGEALLWAARRLSARRERRKILIIISDGSPVDDMTAAVNGRAYLDAHLRGVIQALSADPSRELYAIGIGHDVGAYYPRSVTVSDAEGLASALLPGLAEMLA